MAGRTASSSSWICRVCARARARAGKKGLLLESNFVLSPILSFGPLGIVQAGLAMPDDCLFQKVEPFSEVEFKIPNM